MFDDMEFSGEGWYEKPDYERAELNALDADRQIEDAEWLDLVEDGYLDAVVEDQIGGPEMEE